MRPPARAFLTWPLLAALAFPPSPLLAAEPRLLAVTELSRASDPALTTLREEGEGWFRLRVLRLHEPGADQGPPSARPRETMLFHLLTGRGERLYRLDPAHGWELGEVVSWPGRKDPAPEAVLGLLRKDVNRTDPAEPWEWKRLQVRIGLDRAWLEEAP